MSNTAACLRGQTAILADLFRRRVTSLRSRIEYLELLKTLDSKAAVRLAVELFGKGAHQAAGIDGSMDFDEVLELLLFYVCASGYSTAFNVGSEGVDFDLAGATRIPGLSMSAAVPLWEEDLANVLETAGAGESDPDLRRSRERIPFALMTMAELSLALDIVRSGKYHLLFLDRPLSGTFPGLNRDAATLLVRGGSSLTGIETCAGQLRFVDIFLAVGLGSGRTWIPPRGGNLAYAAIRVLLEHGRVTREDLGKTLHLSSSELQQLIRLLDRLNSRLHNELVEIAECDLKIKEGLSGYWTRAVQASMQVISKIFKDSKHSLLNDDGKWLSVLDLNTVNLFLIYALAEEASNRKVLVIGIAKDTSATEYARAVLPYLLSRKTSKPKLPEIRSDKAFLTVLSAVNPDALPPPWRTPAYDSCFTTLFWDTGGKNPLKAARKVVSREQMFTRSYFQLRSFSGDLAVRSPVFLYDRLIMPEMDREIPELEITERGRLATLRPFIESDQLSEIDNLILYLLSRTDSSEVIEAYGHNQLLYLADKYVKEEVEQMKGLLRGVVELELTPLARREKVFTIARRFRDLRAASERARKKRSGRVKA
ncbi:hypothetical protein KEJ39_06355 [Candidatus Bathyarchaeota archaeon]|nr:hypothetical protein [Candidatus Bathyarchaeota archaeon]